MFSNATVPSNYPQPSARPGVTTLPRELPFSSVSIPRLVSRYSTLRPEAIAVRSGSEVLTYAELEQRANRLARFLVSEGVTTDTPVGLYFKRSLGFVIAALAVLKAGGAYVPLDSSNPIDRILFMVRDSQIPIVLTGSRANLQLASSSDSFRVHLIEDPAISEDADEDFCAEISPNDLAYIIYTSGSTGQPKGVEITHRGLANLVRWHQDAFSVTSADRASQVANLGFDATVWETWPYLAAGASLNLADDLTCKDAVALRDWLLLNDITISFRSDSHRGANAVAGMAEQHYSSRTADRRRQAASLPAARSAVLRLQQLWANRVYGRRDFGSCGAHYRSLRRALHRAAYR